MAIVTAPSVTASVVGSPNSPVLQVGLSPDSSRTLIYGGAGVYDLTVKKDGYNDASQRLTVGLERECLRAATLDAAITLSRKP